MRSPLNDLPKTALGACYAIFVIYLLLPLALMMAMSFKDANFIAFPISNWTLDWYGKVLQDKQFIEASVYSAGIALATTIGATVIGVWIALLISTEGIRGKAILFALACLPAVVPGLINAISMRIFIRMVDIPTGTFAIILSHTVHAVPFVVIMVLTRLRSMPANLVDAARDLGADAFVAFMRVTVPYILPALIGGMIFCVLTSIDDFVRTFFLGGYKPTLPMLIFAKVQGGMSPEINAMATIVLIVTAAIGLYAEHFTRRSRS
ncbi:MULTISPECIES: ABC transporter permease [Agrobacterium]|uniref:ABC transporter, membrane spanning protein (Putrescine) n=2 Tax=Agrobacterium fabrum TaxID=1176649 RepID=Q7D346_AGRFC|nr:MULTISPECIES: ABC transporter permease [Agrobacterium]KEY51770.1 spermidine/putrescine ABC transporter permease [Agrobacterium tumefaciens]AAK90797.2 ABC transporter, membrane spanning protein (putrescine) [Agrobacterium fabrum str. C58]AYM60758.1 spermidine/putrescine transport system permease protein [Agrobacterium fabrum]AYM65869.1 spermidine/putrescine transport system permease protein [Agrobacterium fabrum]EGL62417.1 ABC transporter, membrane spanning protein (putrescine) [Agrobacteriu